MKTAELIKLPYKFYTDEVTIDEEKNAFCDSFLAINFNRVTMFHVFGSLYVIWAQSVK